MNRSDFESELSGLRSHWSPPSPSASLDDRVLNRYRFEFVRRRRTMRAWLSAAVVAAVVAVALGVMEGRHFRRAQVLPASNEKQQRNGYVPVREPKLTIISQGEAP